MFEFDKQIINNDTGIDALDIPGEFIKGVTLLEDNSWIENVCWDGPSAVCAILNKKQVDELYSSFISIAPLVIEKWVEQGIEDEDIATLLIYKVNQKYLAVIMYGYEDELANNLLTNLDNPVDENDFFYIGRDANDLTLLEALIEDHIENEEESNLKFYNSIVKWINKNPEWKKYFENIKNQFGE